MGKKISLSFSDAEFENFLLLFPRIQKIVIVTVRSMDLLSLIKASALENHMRRNYGMR